MLVPAPATRPLASSIEVHIILIIWSAIGSSKPNTFYPPSLKIVLALALPRSVCGDPRPNTRLKWLTCDATLCTYCDSQEPLQREVTKVADLADHYTVPRFRPNNSPSYHSRTRTIASLGMWKFHEHYEPRIYQESDGVMHRIAVHGQSKTFSSLQTMFVEKSNRSPIEHDEHKYSTDLKWNTTLDSLGTIPDLDLRSSSVAEAHLRTHPLHGTQTWYCTLHVNPGSERPGIIARGCAVLRLEDCTVVLSAGYSIRIPHLFLSWKLQNGFEKCALPFQSSNLQRTYNPPTKRGVMVHERVDHGVDFAEKWFQKPLTITYVVWAPSSLLITFSIEIYSICLSRPTGEPDIHSSCPVQRIPHRGISFLLGHISVPRSHLTIVQTPGNSSILQGKHVSLSVDHADKRKCPCCNILQARKARIQVKNP
ncbi:hypothetical protein ACRALDRAFT_207243 [Sodiomyces alcalophilus JCM 7366]|uniref:uncharacterized protein n=1 Tax=Sodiomyces alcalophilus JCM 7366 TaxID=591952 RepID=UPI0039B3A2FD